MKIIYTVILALLVIFIITFSLENTLPIRLRYYTITRTGDYTTYMLIFVTFLARVIFCAFHGYCRASKSYPDNQPPEQDNQGSPPREMKGTEIPPTSNQAGSLSRRLNTKDEKSWTEFAVLEAHSCFYGNRIMNYGGIEAAYGV